MIKKRTLLYLNLFLGFSIIFYVFYIRVIVERLPKELYIYDAENNIKLRLLVIIILGIIIAIIQIISNIILLLHCARAEGKLKKILNSVGTILDDALFETYNLLVNQIPNSYDKLSFISKKFYNIFYNISEIFFIIIEYAIRSLILICFLIDVFVFFRLEFMYKALYLLLISMLIKIFFYMLKDIASNLGILEKDLIITNKGIDEATVLPRTSYRFKDINETADLNYHIDQYILCSKLSGYLENYKKYRQFLQPYFTLIIYSCYLLGWCYILYINFMH